MTPSHRPQWSVPRGRIVVRSLRTDPSQEYLVFVPATAAPDARVLVSVHGISRNAHEQACVFAEPCTSRGVVLVVPIFTAERHRNYQRLGRKPRSSRADLLLNRFLEEVAALTGADVTQFHLFGYSAGAQFAHRYVMAHPHRVTRAVIAAAGWYTFPDPGRRFPYGLRPNRALKDLRFDPEQFLRVPVDVLVGEQDLGSVKLRRTERLDAQQGTSRLARARSWVSAMTVAAAAYGLPRSVSLTEVPDVDHSFAGFCARGALVERVSCSLFGPPVESEPVPARVLEVAGPISVDSGV